VTNAASVFLKTIFSGLNKSPEDPITTKGQGATTRRAAPNTSDDSHLDDDSEVFSDGRLGLTITSTPLGRFVYWKGFEPSELLERGARTGATIATLPYQASRPLATIHEDSLSRMVPASNSSTSDYSPSREVCMAIIRDHGHGDDDEPGSKYNNELLDQISTDEDTAQAPTDEDEERRRYCKMKNARRAKCRSNAKE